MTMKRPRATSLSLPVQVLVAVGDELARALWAAHGDRIGAAASPVLRDFAGGARATAGQAARDFTGELRTAADDAVGGFAARARTAFGEAARRAAHGAWNSAAEAARRAAADRKEIR
ncbi:hypothetical protein [Kitasatospora sp. NPDC056800]|uniref:hypothetical protein n=1 Tax=Kitasatospora sp. NPDC056800 TaxID=3345948 RepID=UPI0036963FA3